MDGELGTPRLSLRPIAEGDAAALHAHWTDERVRRFLFDGEALAPERVRAIVAESRALFAERGFGLWAVRERGGEELLGVAGLWYFRTPPALELVFSVAPERWSEGLATEAARRVVRHALEELGHASVEASTDAANEASLRTLAKAGLERVRRETVAGADTVFFRATREGRPARGRG